MLCYMKKFIFFYSPLYEYYNKHILNRLSEHFDVEPILINDIVKNNNHWHTFCGGVSIKIELIIQKIKENYNKHIIFTDATIFINKQNAHLLPSFFSQYETHDISFADNTGFGAIYNIGVMQIKCNDDTLRFFEMVLSSLITHKGWDQQVVNEHVNRTHLKVGLFDNTKIHCGDNFNMNLIDSYYIYKSFIGHSNDPIMNFNARIHKFYKATLIDEKEFDQSLIK